MVARLNSWHDLLALVGLTVKSVFFSDIRERLSFELVAAHLYRSFRLLALFGIYIRRYRQVDRCRSEVHNIPARVQCTVQVCELALSNLHPPPYRSRQIICLSHSESVRLPLQLGMRPSSHQLHAGSFHPVHACTTQQETSSHTVRCALLVHLWCR
jgi:hypothetical protein